MKQISALILVGLGLVASSFAAEVKGFVQDEKCSGSPAMKGNSACAEKCIKGGSPAVLVADDGKVYKVSNQAMIVDHAGQNVTVTGSVKGDTITVENVK